jgi:hypothetical protein
LVDGRDRLFKVHNQPGQFIGRGLRKSDYKNRFILTGARDSTKTRTAFNPLSARIETPHLLATTDAFIATDYRSFIERKREKGSSPACMGPVTCFTRNRFITFHNVFRRTHFRGNPFMTSIDIFLINGCRN